MMASRLPLKRYRSIPGFLRATVAIRRQLARSEGLIGHSLKADLLRKTFFTLSAWADETVLNHFAGAHPHLDLGSQNCRGDPSSVRRWRGRA
ncbi:hypothetical protein EV650_1520 [Kribbella kalugense]|uniref:Uncharacterized protein n=1 Tax=Kribbella kalugense TaxID=2512221 RepID=A0A4R7ZXF4_9ACTN|nr:hypothetical protein EV650_1520 [Kribbella kalugense]